jgi:hypothetical protein
VILHRSRAQAIVDNELIPLSFFLQERLGVSEHLHHFTSEVTLLQIPVYILMKKIIAGGIGKMDTDITDRWRNSNHILNSILNRLVCSGREKHCGGEKYTVSQQ